jgi:hypothetical protein
MVQRLIEIVADYEQRIVTSMPFVQLGSYERRQFQRGDGGPSREFFTFLFCSRELVITFSSLHYGFVSLQGCYVRLTDLKDGINQTKWLGSRIVVVVSSALVFDTVPYTLTYKLN